MGQGTVVLRVSIRFVMMLTRMWRRFESRSPLFFRRSDGLDIPDIQTFCKLLSLMVTQVPMNRQNCPPQTKQTKIYRH